jgi:hypothetical protein
MVSPCWRAATLVGEDEELGGDCSKMTDQVRTLQDEKIVLGSNKSVAFLGFWAAILTAILAGVFFVLGIMTPARSGPFAPPASVIPYPYTNVANFAPGDYTWLYPGLLLAPLFVVLIACIQAYSTENRKIFGQIGLAFAAVYAAIIMIDYFIQLTVVEPSLLAGESSSLTLFTQYNPHGIFIVLEALGYFMMSVAFLSVAPIFGGGGRLKSAIRWLFVSSFVVAVLSFIGLPLLGYNMIAFEVTVLLVNWIVLIGLGSLLAVLFKRSL